MAVRGIGRLRGKVAAASADADATAWAAAVTANSGTYSAGTLAAIDAFCVAAKAHSYWTKLLRVNPFAGNQLAAALVPLKVGGGNATDTNHNFVGGDYTEAGGLAGNASNKYLDTGLSPTLLTANDTHLSVYVCVSPTANGYDLGMLSGVGSENFALMGDSPSNGHLSDQYSYADSRLAVANAVHPPGHVIATRVSASSFVMYRAGSSVGSVAPGAEGIGATVSPIFVFANNASGPAAVNDSTLGAYSIGSGLTAQNAADFYTDLQALMTALGREV